MIKDILTKIQLFSSTPIDNTDLAEQLFKTLSVGENIEPKYQKTINDIYSKAPKTNGYADRQYILDKVIELIGIPNTPKQRYLIAKAYSWSKSKYRKDAIKYLELYLNNEIYKDIYKYAHHNFWNTEKDELNIHLSNMHHLLATKYEEEYNFEKALNNYETSIKIRPRSASSYLGKISIYKKTNKLNLCLIWLKSVKQTDAYKIYIHTNELGQTITDDWVYKCINKAIFDVNDLIKKGYVYKPRNKKAENV